MRLPAIAAYPTAAERAEIRRRARAARLSVSRYLIAAALGIQSAEAQAADDWWAGCSPSRRASIWRYHQGVRPEPEPIPGQVDLLDFAPAVP